jgi:hypothetical protein
MPSVVGNTPNSLHKSRHKFFDRHFVITSIKQSLSIPTECFLYTHKHYIILVQKHNNKSMAIFHMDSEKKLTTNRTILSSDAHKTTYSHSCTQTTALWKKITSSKNRIAYSNELKCITDKFIEHTHVGRCRRLRAAFSLGDTLCPLGQMTGCRSSA